MGCHLLLGFLLGEELIMSLAQDGAANIYIMNLKTKIYHNLLMEGQ